MLRLQGINAFYGRAQSLFNVTLRVDRGEVTVLAGRNGAGKSTTLRSVLGLVDRRQGRVLFEGNDISALAVDAIVRRGVGYVPEDRRIFTDLTVAENLLVGALPARDGLPAWTEEKVLALFPNLAELRRRPAGAISGGEQQMLAIARSLMGNPLLIMLDEPSEGLAPKIVEQMAAAIIEMKRCGLSVLLAEQNVHFALAVGDRAYILEKGRVHMGGTAASLLSDQGITRAYLAV